MGLLREAKQRGSKIDVVMLEHNKFSEQRYYSQFIGVSSLPFEDILGNELGLINP
jgi:hypothetical protein